MPPSLRSLAAVAALVVATVAAPATAAGAVPAPDAPAALDGPVADVPADPLADVAELARQADELAEQVRRQQQAVAAEQARLAAAQVEASAALEAFQLAQRHADEATRLAAEQAQRARLATARTDAARARLQAYVGGLYRQGMGSQQMSTYGSLLGSRGPESFLTGLSLAERVGARQGGEVLQLAAAQAEQQQAEEQAGAAQQAAVTATEVAAAAQQTADRAVEQVDAQLQASAELLLDTEVAAVAAEQREADAVAAAEQREAERRALMARAEQVARERASAPSSAIEAPLVPRPSADCQGDDVRGYPNGRLTTSALCPLWGTSGQVLRADAAAAFEQMSRAYAQQFGAPICVTDSYRTYDEQVAVRAAKPDLAAVPGTSNHGWAVAVDLCDGVQVFGSPAHERLRRNSLRYGWFLPAWAMPGGSKPEPWHWEFAG